MAKIVLFRAWDDIDGFGLQRYIASIGPGGREIAEGLQVRRWDGRSNDLELCTHEVLRTVWRLKKSIHLVTMLYPVVPSVAIPREASYQVG